MEPKQLRPQAHLAAIINSSDDAIVSKDLNGIVMSWNPAAERMFGWTSAEIVGQSILKIIPAARRSEEDLVLSRVRAGLGVDHFETVRQRKDGSLIDVSLTVSPVRDTDGTIIGASKIARDITIRKRLAQAEHQQLVRERTFQAEANRIKDEFLATLSHELRTPLNAIIGWTEMMLAGHLTEQEQELGLKTIDRNARAQVQLVDDLLDVSRITTGKMRLQLISVDLVEVAKNGLDIVRPAANAKKIKLISEFGRPEILVQADPDRLQQVAWNLLSNAIKFTPARGQVTLKVDTDDDGNALFTVEDSGMGIPEKFLPHVFDRFKQADGSLTRSHGGLGLGLAIVRHIVELHGGVVEVESPGENKGTKFKIVFPGVSGRRQPNGFTRPETTGGQNLEGVRVLVVDDREDERQLLQMILSREGAQVETAGSAADGLTRLATLRPQVVVSDIAMPTEDGYTLIKKIRALDDRILAAIPAIALTAHARIEDRQRALDAGFDYHVGKPFDRVRLIDAVGAALDLAGGTQRPKSASPARGTPL
ncbi:MAG TPA: PAS domain S-box protein [Gemmatimonadaceae bacterium]|nr:PAS domain S-box protein [Gemmatimonadaceae bacterium]